jgi:hypothetical protein
MDVQALKTALQAGLVTINFTKVNGHKRRMVATLDPAIHPATTYATGVTRDAALLVVWDTEQNGWRTIKVDSIHDWTPGVVEAPVSEAPSALTIGWTPATPTPTPAS